jgi:phosphoribosylformimino-5-aminoimidazole carboxamide ribotide isomerase
VSFTVFPSVDITDGRCVRLMQGSYGNERVYSDDPVRVALGFCRAGARWLHIVDLDGARDGDQSNRELVLEVVRSAACPVQAGGGLRTIDDITEVVAAGAGRAMVGAEALDDLGALHGLCARFGERVAALIEARSGNGSSEKSTATNGIALPDALQALEDAGVAMIVYVDLDRDGTTSGPNLDELERLATLTDVPLIAAGGITSLDDVRAVARLHDMGVRGAVVGRALYEHKFGIVEAQHLADEAAAGRDVPPLVEGR